MDIKYFKLRINGTCWEVKEMFWKPLIMILDTLQLEVLLALHMSLILSSVQVSKPVHRDI